MNVILIYLICSVGFFGWLKNGGKNHQWNVQLSLKKNDVLGFISRCYDMLHLSSYECALDDVEEMLRNRGVLI